MAQDVGRYQDAMQRGETYNTNEQWKEAIGAFRVAVKEFPNRAEPYAGLGTACVGLKQFDKALECYKFAARYSRGDLQYLRKVADIQERLGQMSEAARTTTAVGEILLRQRHIDDALDNWLRAVGLEPNLLGAHRRLASVFQRRNDTRGAVREYLAIARILQQRGEKDKALQMCRAALRLDPDSKDVRTAMELIRFGEEAFADEEDEEEEEVATEPEPTEEDELTSAVRQMASILEEEKQNWKLTQEQSRKAQTTSDPVDSAKRFAQEQLAEEIFRDEEDEDVLYGTGSGMSKLERDALIGQAMDFETRGEIAGAIDCYEKAINGGLNMPAAHFALGLLYIQDQRASAAQQSLTKSAENQDYAEASRVALSRIQ
jgi:tetratricopeptide (TPR) repeat protein